MSRVVLIGHDVRIMLMPWSKTHLCSMFFYRMLNDRSGRFLDVNFEKSVLVTEPIISKADKRFWKPFFGSIFTPTLHINGVRTVLPHGVEWPWKMGVRNLCKVGKIFFQFLNCQILTRCDSRTSILFVMMNMCIVLSWCAIETDFRRHFRSAPI